MYLPFLFDCRFPLACNPGIRWKRADTFTSSEKSARFHRNRRFFPVRERYQCPPSSLRRHSLRFPTWMLYNVRVREVNSSSFSWAKRMP